MRTFVICKDKNRIYSFDRRFIPNPTDEHLSYTAPLPAFIDRYIVDQQFGLLGAGSWEEHER